MVKLDKGDFIGRDAHRDRSARRAAPRQLVGLELTAARIGRDTATRSPTDGGAVGVVTSGTFGRPSVEQSIAMAYVAAPPRAVGTRAERR